MATVGRPPKNNCDYFRHFTTMRNHRKVKILRNKFGMVLGYAFWAMILEYITESDGNEFEFSDIETEMFAAELGVSATEIRDMVNFCVSIEMLFNRNGFIYSESLDKELKFVYEKRNQSKEISATQKRRKNGRFYSNTDSNGVSVTDITEPTDNTVEVMPQIREDKIREDNQIDWEFEKEKFLINSEHWENYQRNNKLYAAARLEERKSEFIKMIEDNGDQKSLKELKRHFGNWNKPDLSEKTKQTPTIQFL